MTQWKSYLRCCSAWDKNMLLLLLTTNLFASKQEAQILQFISTFYLYGKYEKRSESKEYRIILSTKNWDHNISCYQEKMVPLLLIGSLKNRDDILKAPSSFVNSIKILLNNNWPRGFFCFTPI